MSPKKSLYLRLSKDADSVAKREKRYALIAKNERKFSGKDLIMARHRKMPARQDDDIFEKSICDEFYRYRMGVSKHFFDVAKRYKKLAARVS